MVALDRFQGPLDLLLHLIRSQDIDIFDIPIAQITRQFHSVLEAGIERMELDRAGEFLELAATLIRIKAQLLLPRHGEDEWEEDPRAELVRRLLEYEFFQEVAYVLGAAENERRRHFGKGYLPVRPKPPTVRGDLETTLDEFLEVALEIPEPAPEPTHLAPIRVVPVEEKIAAIHRHFTTTERLLFSRLFRSWRERPHVVAALLACLEMAKQQTLRIEQVKRFGSIWLFRGSRAATPVPDEDPAADPAERGETSPSPDLASVES